MSDKNARFSFSIIFAFDFAYDFSGKRTVSDLNFKTVCVFEASLVWLFTHFLKMFFVYLKSFFLQP